jgi:HK97 family phage prohead protease
MSPRQLAGRAIVFNQMSLPLGGFVEIIDPGALDKTDLTDVRLFRDHDSARIVARTTAKSLKLTISRGGLDFVAELADTTDGRDAFALVDRGDVHACSFGFTLGREDWVMDKKSGMPIRIVTEIRSCPELTLTSMPAYPQTYVTVGSMVRDADTPKWVRDRSPAERARWDLARAEREQRASKPLDWSAVPGIVPIPRPADVRCSMPGGMNRRSLAHGPMPIEVAAMLMEPDMRADDMIEAYQAESPQASGTAGYALMAYRSLARSRGIELQVVVDAAREGRLADVVALPEAASAEED